MTEIEFKAWIKDNWIDAGGLITQKTASMITGLSQSEISRKINTGDLKAWTYPGMKGAFVSFTESMNLKRERAPKKKKNSR